MLKESLKRSQRFCELGLAIGCMYTSYPNYYNWLAIQILSLLLMIGGFIILLSLLKKEIIQNVILSVYYIWFIIVIGLLFKPNVILDHPKVQIKSSDKNVAYDMSTLIIVGHWVVLVYLIVGVL
uniref:Uncharacterized protein n=1 Tax=Strigamia maritima TaxID=126957 RepID=T1ILV6_STRMM